MRVIVYELKRLCTCRTMERATLQAVRGYQNGPLRGADRRRLSWRLQEVRSVRFFRMRGEGVRLALQAVAAVRKMR